MVAVSLLLISFSQVIQLYGLRHITAGLAAVISSALTPIALLGFSAALGQERFTWRQAAAIAVGVVGICVLFGPKAFTGELRLAEVAGAGRRRGRDAALFVRLGADPADDAHACRRWTWRG